MTAICWDQWFPEAARAMVLQGAEILFYPTAIGSEPQDEELDSRDHWRRVMQGHAGANLVNALTCKWLAAEVQYLALGGLLIILVPASSNSLNKRPSNINLKNYVTFHSKWNFFLLSFCASVKDFVIFFINFATMWCLLSKHFHARGTNLFWMNSGTYSSFKSHRKGGNWETAWKKWDHILREFFHSRYSSHLSVGIIEVESMFK